MGGGLRGQGGIRILRRGLCFILGLEGGQLGGQEIVKALLHQVEGLLNARCHVAAFVEDALEAWRVDRRRVHITGFSQGGAMTYWMRCNRSDLFASAAPTAMSGTACTNGLNMPTLYIQGNDDIFISESAIAGTIASFRNRHGLSDELVVATTPDYTWTIYRNPDPSVTQFTAVIHNYSANGVRGHCILGSVTPTNPYGCDQPAPAGHGRVVVDFFKNHPRSS